MSITDELRAWAREHRVLVGGLGLEEIADRIDEELANYVELPKDADGETIRIGDKVEVIGYESGTVAALQLDERRWSVAVRPHGWDTPTAYDAESIRHVKPDSWERIIEDAQADGVRYHNEGKPSDFDALVERCKRLAGEDE